MSPAAELDHASQIWIALLVVPGILDLSQEKRWIIDAKVDAVSIALLRVVGSGPCLIAIEYRPKNSKVVVDVD